MSHQMNLFSGVVVDCLIEQLKKKLHSARTSFTRIGDSCQFYIQKGEREFLQGITIQSNAQVKLRNHYRELTFSLNHPDAIHRLAEQLIRIIQLSFDPFDDESLGPELIRQLVVGKAIKTVEGRDDQENKRIHAVVSQALKDLGLKPMRFPNSRRDQIRRAFLLLVGLESAPESCKASWMHEFQTASCELGTMRIDGAQISFNPYLLYRKLKVEENLRKAVTDACRPFQLFVERETIDEMIEDWTR
jgi:hypothetical protein